MEVKEIVGKGAIAQVFHPSEGEVLKSYISSGN